MFKVKQLFDEVEKDDGHRLWVEPIGLTTDLREWCKVDALLEPFAPARKLWFWFDEHPDGYDYFRAGYHEQLAKKAIRKELLKLVSASRNETFTLLHQGSNPSENTAAALHEFLLELDAYVPPET